MVVLIEGNEGTGKTTLINKLSKYIPFISVKYPKEIKHTYNMYINMMQDNNVYVLDRGLISDIVYRLRDYNKGQMTLEEIGLITSHRHDVRVVFCWHDKSYENSMRRGEDYITSEKDHDDINRNFWLVKQLLDCFTDINTFSYNYEHCSVEDVANFIQGGV